MGGLGFEDVLEDLRVRGKCEDEVDAVLRIVKAVVVVKGLEAQLLGELYSWSPGTGVGYR